MAKITVTTDEGEIVKILCDEEGTFEDLGLQAIGDLSKPFPRSEAMRVIASAVTLARKTDNRNQRGEKRR